VEITANAVDSEVRGEPGDTARQRQQATPSDCRSPRRFIERGKGQWQGRTPRRGWVGDLAEASFIIRFRLTAHDNRASLEIGYRRSGGSRRAYARRLSRFQARCTLSVREA
jgi:hypothetical protein